MCILDFIVNKIRKLTDFILINRKNVIQLYFYTEVNNSMYYLIRYIFLAFIINSLFNSYYFNL